MKKIFPIKIYLIILLAIFYLAVTDAIASDSLKVGIVVTYPGNSRSLTVEKIQKSYALVKQAGIKVSNCYYAWGQMEQENGKYNWQDADFINFIKNQGMDVSVEIKLVDVNKVGFLPKDIEFTSFSLEAFKGRFKKFILTFLDRYAKKIDYLWIGNEVDEYFYTHRNQIDDYAKLYEEVVLLVKQKYPRIKIGVISTYHDAKNHQALDIIERIGKYGDLIGFSFYPQMIKGKKQSDVNDAFAQMSVIGKRINKKFAILETGLSTRGFGGSEARQAEFTRDLFRAYNNYKSNLEFLGLFILYDLPDSLNKAVAAGYGIEGNKEFLNFQGSLGLLYNNGKVKKSWLSVLKEMKRENDKR